VSQQDAQLLKEAISKAIQVYNYWRPELRYKTIEITEKQLEVVRRAAKWFVDHQERL